MATLTVGVQTHENDAQSALSSNASKMNAVISAIEAQGVPANHIQTSNLSLWYDSEQNQFVVQHDLTVKIDNVSSVGVVLDAAVGAGANTSWGVTFGLTDQTSAQTQALAAAVANARSHANAIASALGVSISGVGSASEASYTVTPPHPVYAGAALAPTANTTPVQSGELTVTADVNVVYTFG